MEATSAPRKDTASNVFFRQFAAGFSGGVCAKFAEHPLDTIKVTMQVGEHSFRNPVECAKHIWNQGGFRAFYRGIAAPVAGAGLENAAAFAAYGSSSAFFHRFPSLEGKPLPLSLVALSGAWSGVFTTAVLTPVEYVKCRVQTRVEPNVRACVSKAWKQGGIKTFYAGATATLMRETAGNSAWFSTFEFVSRRFGEDRKLHHNASAGACAGIMYWSVLYPMDVVKTRVQSNPEWGKQGIKAALRAIYKEGGMRALYSGWTTTIVRAAPANAIIFSVYDIVLKRLERGGAAPS